MRFWTPFIKDKLQELTIAQQQLDEAQKDQVSPQCPKKAAGRAILDIASRVWLPLLLLIILFSLLALVCIVPPCRCAVCSQRLMNTGSCGRALCVVWRTWTLYFLSLTFPLSQGFRGPSSTREPARLRLFASRTRGTPVSLKHTKAASTSPTMLL